MFRQILSVISAVAAVILLIWTLGNTEPDSLARCLSVGGEVVLIGGYAVLAGKHARFLS